MNDLETLQRLVEQQKAEIEQLKNDLKLALAAWRKLLE
jgi:hypothetical protein